MFSQNHSLYHKYIEEFEIHSFHFYMSFQNHSLYHKYIEEFEIYRFHFYMFFQNHNLYHKCIYQLLYFILHIYPMHMFFLEHIADLKYTAYDYSYSYLVLIRIRSCFKLRMRMRIMIMIQLCFYFILHIFRFCILSITYSLCLLNILEFLICIDHSHTLFHPRNLYCNYIC